MKTQITVSVVVILLVCTCRTALAGNNPNAKCAVHVNAHNAKQTCSNLPLVASCEDIVPTYAGSNFDAFPVFYDLTEYKGFEYGMSWPNWTYSASFTSCSDLVIGEILNPGDGASHAWFLCQPYSVAIPSFIWLYADGPGGICVVNHPIGSEGPEIYVMDCGTDLDNPIPIACAGVYGASGDDPCATVSTEATTWGEVKSLFR